LIKARLGQRQLRLNPPDVDLVGSGIDLNSTSPFLTGLLPSTGTSITRPRTWGRTCTTYLITRTSADDGAKTLSSRISAVSPTIGMVTTTTCDLVFQGSHLNLMKISQTKKAYMPSRMASISPLPARP
jgi:hypothetical protein